eukprot:g13077.t1
MDWGYEARFLDKVQVIGGSCVAGMKLNDAGSACQKCENPLVSADGEMECHPCPTCLKPLPDQSACYDPSATTNAPPSTFSKPQTCESFLQAERLRAIRPFRLAWSEQVDYFCLAPSPPCPMPLEEVDEKCVIPKEMENTEPAEGCPPPLVMYGKGCVFPRPMRSQHLPEAAAFSNKKKAGVIGILVALAVLGTCAFCFVMNKKRRSAARVMAHQQLQEHLEIQTHHMNKASTDVPFITEPMASDAPTDAPVEHDFDTAPQPGAVGVDGTVTVGEDEPARYMFKEE